jgi:hypothetical protein
MFTTPSRITGIETTADRAARPATALDHQLAADHIDQDTREYNHRYTGSVEFRRQQDSSTLYYLFGELENHVRCGGDPRIADIIRAAIDHGTGRS